MKYLNLTLFVFLISAIVVTAQNQHTIDMSSGKLMIQGVDRVTFEGHNASSVIIEKEGDEEDEDDERAKGLRVINALGMKDNTGLGLGIEKTGEGMVIQQITSTSDDQYIIKVPRGVSIYYEHSSSYGEEIKFHDVAGEIEVSANYNDIVLKNVSGPVSVNTVYGNVDAEFGSVSQDNPISIYSVYGHVDVTVPESTKANFRLHTSYGAMFTDLDLDFEYENKEGMKKLDGKKTIGKLNGGGVEFHVKATYDNIYLRKN